MSTPARYYSSIAVRTTLATSITSGDVELTVASDTGFPQAYPFTLILEKDSANEEIVTVTGAVGTAYTIVRGVDGTAPRSHAAGTPAEHGVSALDFTDFRAHEGASTNAHGVGIGNAIVGTGTSQTLSNKTLGSNLAAGGFKVTGLADPTSAQESATKNYVDTGVTSQVVIATTQASNASSSASAASGSASAASSSAAAALASEQAAAASELAAAASESAASSSQSLAASSESAAIASAAAALASEGAASASEIAAAASENAASSSEANAAASEGAAAASELAAAASEAAALASEQAASASEIAAAASELAASGSESAAAASASAASSSASAASSSASAASGSASTAQSAQTAAETARDLAQDWAIKTDAPVSGTSYGAKYYSDLAAVEAGDAANSAVAAAASASAAATTFDDFDDRYLGAKSSDPTLDNDGDPLVAGALYFSTSLNLMRVYDGALWVDTTSVAGQTISVVTSTSRPSAPSEPTYIYESDTDTTLVWNGSAWVTIGGGATGGGNDAVFHENDTVVSASYTIGSGKNAGTFGPITVNSGVTVTVPSGSVWSIV
jgi:hypothetical protein